MVNPIGGPSPVGDNVADPGQAAGQSYNTGVTDLQNGDYASAYTNLLAASQDKVFSSQNPQVFYYMGLSAEYSGASGLTPDAKECFKTYLQQPSTDPSLVASAKGQICMVDAQTALNSNDYETALKDYQQAGVDDPSLVTQLAGTIGQIKGQIDINKANAAQTANDVAGMLKWYQQAALDDPSMAPQLASTITKLTSQNQFNTDWPAIQNQINDAYTASSGNLMEGGGPQAAIDILQGVLDKYPEVKTYYPNIYLTMAQFAFQGSYVDQAKQYFADFAPTMASPDLDAQTLESAKYLGTQLYGNKLANWPNYVANLLGHTFGGDANLWNNFLINPLTGYMPQSEPKMFGGKRFNTEKAYNLDYGSDPLGHVNEQLHDVKEQLAGTSDPEGKAALEGMKGQLEQQIKQIQAAKNSPGTRIGSDGKELAPDDVKSSFRSFQNGEHYSKTISTNEDVKTPTGEVAEKGDVSGAGGPGFWGIGQTLAEYKTQEDEIGTINYQASGGQGLDAWSAQGSGSSAVMRPCSARRDPARYIQF
ncbi:MAG: hypothetical protein WCK42_03400 [Myxococcaceae bacterium]